MKPGAAHQQGDPGGERLSPFQPFPFLRSPHLQTILASQLHLPFGPPSRLEQVAVPGGDRVALEVATPAGWRPDGPTALLVHGLCGSSRSPYLVRLARRLHRRGIRSVRMNLRGCGPGRGLAREPYHSGRSEDVRVVLAHLRAGAPDSPIAVAGYSLGGNIVLKLAGELGGGATALIECAVAICPPVDLLASSRKLARLENRLYESLFVRDLRRDVLHRQRCFGDPVPSLSRRMTLREFDDAYTAPRCGFADALDYYTRASSAPLLPRIAVPTRILVAEDDPLIDAAVLRDASLPPHVHVEWSPRGGHLGFLGRPGSPGGFRWMDSLVLEWLADVNCPSAPPAAPPRRR
jgi:hypothetical protein